MQTPANKTTGATTPILPATTLSGVVGAVFLAVFALQAASAFA